MKTLGLIGGLSWFSTEVYYRTINQKVNERLGGAHSAKLLLYSVDFQEFKTLQETGDWETLEKNLSDIANRLQKTGAEAIVLCTNTPHLVADAIQQKINIPLLHIAEETGKEIIRKKIGKVGLLGTKFTMEHSFFRDRIAALGIDSIIPNNESREFIHTSIFNELTKGIFKEETREGFLHIIEQLKSEGAGGVVLGCTEISLLINQSESSLPLFDTAIIHATAAVEFSLQ